MASIPKTIPYRTVGEWELHSHHPYEQTTPGLAVTIPSADTEGFRALKPTL